MKLILVRHGKSSWDTNHSDHDRPLASRGIKAAEKIGDWLNFNKHHPDSVLCSSAVRTRQTWDIIKAQLPAVKHEKHVKELYGASGRMMFMHLQGLTGETVLMVGHNPGMAEFAHRLLLNPPETTQFRRFPTCATLVCKFQTDHWKSIKLGHAILLDFVVPREL